MKSKFYSFKNNVIELRKSGKTYGEIIDIIGQKVPKSTLSCWCHTVYLNSKQRKIIETKIIKNCQKGREVAWMVNKERREQYLKSIKDRNLNLVNLFNNKNVAKLALAVLYLGEGSKKTSGSVMLGNSDPNIINLFLKLLRFCYNINETKLHCTLQCRADQDVKSLENFWSKVTQIPLSQFYKARIDPRTIGKPSKKLDYKGVCRIDYFSADVFNELMIIGKIICGGL